MLNWRLVTTCFAGQKRKVLSDPTLPPEFRISLAKSLRHDLFFQVFASADVKQCFTSCTLVIFCNNLVPALGWLGIADSVPYWHSGEDTCNFHCWGKAGSKLCLLLQGSQFIDYLPISGFVITICCTLRLELTMNIGQLSGSISSISLHTKFQFFVYW